MSQKTSQTQNKTSTRSSKRKSKSSRPEFQATPQNWKAAYTKILGYVQKGLPDSEIADLVDLSARTVGDVRRSPYFKTRLAKAQEAYERQRAKRLADIQSEDKTMKTLERNAAKAVRVLVKALRGKEEVTKSQISVAQDILDRTGYKAKDKLEVESHNHNYTKEEIENARETLAEVTSMITQMQSGESDFVLKREHAK